MSTAGSGREERFEREAGQGVEAAERDEAALREEAAALREEASRLDRTLPEPDAGG